MALTGHLSDLSLSELIEFFCNQRKTGSLKVLYPDGAGYFFLQTGSVIDAQIGVLRGIDAVYYALTLPNAKFEFSASTEPVERTINQPWTQVVLEGLRRLDEGIEPQIAFPAGFAQPEREPEVVVERPALATATHLHIPAFLSFMNSPAVSQRKTVLLGAAGVAVLASVAVIGVPAGWYRHKPAPAVQTEAVVGAASTEPTTTPAPVTEQVPQPTTSPEENHAGEEAQAAAKKQREKERKQREERAAAASQSPSISTPAPAVESLRPGQKRVVVTVTYDESGRVTQASGGDPTALRIARQKRFPAGKAGSATVTIPIN